MSWRRVTLRDVGKIVGGGTPSTRDPGNFGDTYPWITPKDLSRQAQRFIAAGERGITEAGLLGSSAKLLPSGTVIVSSRAPIGLTAIAQTPLATNQGCRSFVPSDEADSLFMYYLLGSMTEEFERLANGSTFKEISGSTLAGVEIDLPPLEEQRSIAETLGALDDKIESNRRAMRCCQDLIRACVDSAILEADAPNSGTLGDYCALVKDGVKHADLAPGEAYIGLEHMPRESIWLCEWQSAGGLASNKFRFQQGDILFGKLRPYFKKVGIAPVAGVCSTDVLVLRPVRAYDRALVAVVASSDALIDSVSAAATGTRMPRASWADVSDWPVPRLEIEDRRRLGSITNPMIDRMLALIGEQGRLQRLRDTLLPELISGRLRVLEAGEELE